jgi:23S rRNA pseudouridine2605 synthase
MSTAMRIQRALARAGIASRRKAEELVAAGRVRVNGEVATVGHAVDIATDRITVDGRPIDVAPTAPVWIVLHKPAGVITTRRDPQGRRTVFDLVPDVPGLTYVGRLDFDTEGLLLLTTDGAAAHCLTHPSLGVEREYVATVRGDAPAAARQAPAGVSLGDGVARPTWARARRLDGDRWAFMMGLAEGRKREVRRICQALGLKVERLVRVRFGPVELGSLAEGETRALSARELRAIEALCQSAHPTPGPAKIDKSGAAGTQSSSKRQRNPRPASGVRERTSRGRPPFTEQ